MFIYFVYCIIGHLLQGVAWNSRFIKTSHVYLWRNRS